MAVTTKCSPLTMISFCSRQSFYRLLFGVWLFLLTPHGSLLLLPSHDHMQLFLCFTPIHKAPGHCARGPRYPKFLLNHVAESSPKQKPWGRNHSLHSRILISSQVTWEAVLHVFAYCHLFSKPSHSPNVRVYLNLFHILSLSSLHSTSQSNSEMSITLIFFSSL